MFSRHSQCASEVFLVPSFSFYRVGPGLPCWLSPLYHVWSGGCISKPREILKTQLLSLSSIYPDLVNIFLANTDYTCSNSAFQLHPLNCMLSDNQKEHFHWLVSGGRYFLTFSLMIPIAFFCANLTAAEVSILLLPRQEVTTKESVAYFPFLAQGMEPAHMKSETVYWSQLSSELCN